MNIKGLLNMKYRFTLVVGKSNRDRSIGFPHDVERFALEDAIIYTHDGPDYVYSNFMTKTSMDTIEEFLINKAGGVLETSIVDNTLFID